jgi:CHAD domain-containing protein
MPIKSKAPAPIHAEQTTSIALATILHYHFEILISWQENASSWADIEGVHQMRVATRRLRSALSLFRSAVPKNISQLWLVDLRWIGEQLGYARDLDVLISEGLTPFVNNLKLTAETSFRQLAEEKRADAYQQKVIPLLEGARYQQFCPRFSEWVASRAWEQAPGTKKSSKQLAMPITDYARQVLDKQEQKVLKTGKGIDYKDNQAMHQLRIECKKLRYAAEFFTPLCQELSDYIGHLKKLQDILGVLHDVSLTQELLQQLLAGQQNPDLFLYAGAVIGWRSHQAQILCDDFDRAWNELIAVKHLWWQRDRHEDDCVHN